MPGIRKLTHRFIEYVPDDIENGVLYISITFATATHRCCCGCGKEVVTPLTPTDWTLIFDGESISLTPSIGNWSFACRSHYWIRRNQVVWAPEWSESQIVSGRLRDVIVKQQRYGAIVDSVLVPPSDSSEYREEANGVWSRFKQWFLRRS
jgi:hypothetical protein